MLEEACAGFANVRVASFDGLLTDFCQAEGIVAIVKGLRAVSPDAISMYVGTAAGFSLLHPIFAEGFMKGVGSHNVFSSSTQDCANRFAAATEMYGFPFTQPFVDLDHVRYMLIVGTNPVVSKWTFLQVAHPVKRLKEVLKRGGRIVVVDPRLTETAKVADTHHFIRPNTDVFFFLSFLHELFVQNGVDRAHVSRYMRGLDEVEALAQLWPAQRTAELTGVAADALRSGGVGTPARPPPDVPAAVARTAPDDLAGVEHGGLAWRDPRLRASRDVELQHIHDDAGFPRGG